VAGTWKWLVLSTYEHDLVIPTQNPNGTFLGTGGYPAGQSPYNLPGQTPETITGGQVSNGNQVKFTTTYSGPYNPGYSVTVLGYIASDGKMIGTSPWEWHSTLGAALKDTDCDGKTDSEDNCVLISNPGQEDFDGDKLGDVCDDDIDGDGYLNEVDCDDYNEAIHPEATALCNGLDDDCNGTIDDGNVCQWSCGLTADDYTTMQSLVLGTNRWVYDGSNWKTVYPKGKGPSFVPRLEDTHNCSCSQILDWLHINLPDQYGEMNGHWKYGCSQSAIQEFMRLADEIPYTTGDVGFSSPWGDVELDFSAWEVLPATGNVNWARVTGYINSWSGPVIWTDVIDANTAFFTVLVDKGTPPAVLGCDITFKVVDNGGPNTDTVQITAVVDDPLDSRVCGAVGQVQGPYTINSGNLIVNN